MVVNDVDADVAEATADEISKAGGQGRRRGLRGRLRRSRGSARQRRGARLRAPRRDVHQRGHPSRSRALEHDRRGLRRRHRNAPARHVHVRACGGAADARAGIRRTHRRRVVDRRTARQLRADELRGRQGGDRRVRSHLGDGVREAQHHRQRHRAQRDHPHDLDHSGDGSRWSRPPRRASRCPRTCARGWAWARPRTSRRCSCFSAPTRLPA